MIEIPGLGDVGMDPELLIGFLQILFLYKPTQNDPADVAVVLVYFSQEVGTYQLGHPVVRHHNVDFILLDNLNAFQGTISNNHVVYPSKCRLETSKICPLIVYVQYRIFF